MTNETAEWIRREDYESIVEDGVANDKDAGGPEVDESGRTRREYVESYLRPQYRIIGEDK